MKQTVILITKNTVLSLLSLGVATGLAFGLNELGLRSENLLLVYLLAILGITILTKQIYYSFLGSIGSVLLFNFFFTEPRYSFAMDDPNYYISLAIFLAVSTVIFVMTSLTQKESERRKKNERKLESLNNFSNELLLHSDKKDVFSHLYLELERYFGKGLCYVKEASKEEIIYPDNILPPGPIVSALNFVVSEGKTAGFGTDSLANLPLFAFPLLGERRVYGGIAISLSPKHGLNKEDYSFVSSLSHIASSTLDKDEALEDNEKTALEVENEKFKTALLRSLSHDIRTPLTALQTGSSFLLDGYAGLDDNSKRDIIRDMNEETIRLTDFVDNLLSLTKVSSGMKNIPMKKELADDLLDEACSTFSKRLGNHKLSVVHTDEPLYVYSDGKLIIQVIRNLISNAIVHTKEGSSITLSCKKKRNEAVFLVEDNGGGLSEEASKNLFKDFSSFVESKSDKYRGNGLGLSICASIVKAHHGEIEGHNNDIGGASFSFSLPLNRGKQK